MTNTNVILGRAGKVALRKACRNHASWKQWAKDNGIEGTPTKDQMLEFADHTDIDVAAIVAAAETGTPAPSTPSTPATRATAPAAPAKADDEGDDEADGDDDEAATAPGHGVVVPVGMLADGALASVSQFLSGAMLDQLKADVAGAIEKAADEASRAVAKQALSAHAGGNGSAPAYQARKTGQTTLGRAFGVTGRAQGVKLDVYNDLRAPASDALHVFDNETVAAMAGAINRGRHVWLYGPRGTGKTSYAREFAARLGRRYVRIGFHRWIDPQALYGGWKMVNGSMQWLDGALTDGARSEGCVLHLDEPSAAVGGTNLFLQTVLDEGFITIAETGERVELAPGVIVIVTDNTQGSGDEIGVYTGTGEQSSAFLDRFAFSIPVDYLPVAKECELLAGRYGLTPDRVAPFVEFADRTRRAPETDEPVGHRALCYWVEACLDGMNCKQAFTWAVENKMRPAFRQFAREQFNAHFDVKAAMAALDGKAAPAPAQSGGLTPDELDDARDVLADL